jgi:hypothetical protein
MTHEERLRAFDAAKVLDVLGDVFADLDSRYISAWRASADAAGREDWWQRQRALADVKRELFGRVENAALREGGKDKALNAARNAAKKGVTHG